MWIKEKTQMRRGEKREVPPCPTQEKNGEHEVQPKASGLLPHHSDCQWALKTKIIWKTNKACGSYIKSQVATVRVMLFTLNIRLVHRKRTKNPDQFNKETKPDRLQRLCLHLKRKTKIPSKHKNSILSVAPHVDRSSPPASFTNQHLFPGTVWHTVNPALGRPFSGLPDLHSNKAISRWDCVVRPCLK